MKEGSFNAAVLQVIRDARGEPLHAREILRRTQQIGATTNAKDPIGVTDLVAHGLSKHHPIKKVAGRTWAWVGEIDGALPLLVMATASSDMTN